MSESYPLETVYCTDEAVAILAPADFGILTPPSSVLAEGTDGLFEAGAPWRMSSGTADFGGQGVKPGALVKLERASLRGSGSHYAVASVDGHEVTLRRIGMAEGVGQPPAPPAGLTEVKFTITTLAPQIEAASDEINRQFGIDPRSASRGPSAVDDLRELELATALIVLRTLYGASARAGDGDFALKLASVSRRLSEVLARLQVRWTPGGSGGSHHLFAMRIDRG